MRQLESLKEGRTEEYGRRRRGKMMDVPRGRRRIMPEKKRGRNMGGGGGLGRSCFVRHCGSGGRQECRKERIKGLEV